MWRYLFVLVDETLRLLRARAARSGEAGLPAQIRRQAGLAPEWRRYGGQPVPARLRAQRPYLYGHAIARYDGEVRALPADLKRCTAHLAGGLALFALLLVGSYLFSY